MDGVKHFNDLMSFYGQAIEQKEHRVALATHVAMTIQGFELKDEAQRQCFEQYKGGDFEIIYLQGNCQITAKNQFSNEDYKILDQDRPWRTGFSWMNILDEDNHVHAATNVGVGPSGVIVESSVEAETTHTDLTPLFIDSDGRMSDELKINVSSTTKNSSGVTILLPPASSSINRQLMQFLSAGRFKQSDEYSYLSSNEQLVHLQEQQNHRIQLTSNYLTNKYFRQQQ